MKTRRQFLAGAGALTLGSGASNALALPPNEETSAVKNDWPIALPDSQGIDPAALERVLDAAKSVYALRSLVVARNGFLIAERYYGSSASSLFAINSVTKSVTSMLVGIALQQGRIKSLQETVGDLLPEESAALSSPINRKTLAQILSQTTGLPNDAAKGGALAVVADPVAYVRGLAIGPGDPSPWNYSNAAVSLLSPILRRAVGAPMEEYGKLNLLAPLGIEDYAWDTDNVGNAMSFSGLRLRTRDLAKLAWTMSNNGRWRDKQIVTADWARDSIQPYASPNWRLSPISGTGYGYLWFTGALHGRPVFWGWGYGAQFALAVPSLGLVVSTAARNPSSGDLAKQNVDVMAVVAQVVDLIT